MCTYGKADEYSEARNSIVSSRFLSPKSNPNGLQGSVLYYELISKAKNDDDKIKQQSDRINLASIPLRVKSNKEILVFKEAVNDKSIKTSNQVCFQRGLRSIAPKLSESIGKNKHKIGFGFDSEKKKDDKRRRIHNEIERRRRNKINTWIFKLKELIPESAEAYIKTDAKYKQSTINSKSQILVRAYDYIKQVQEEVKRLRECLMEDDNRLSNQQLQLELNQLKSDILQPRKNPTNK